MFKELDIRGKYPSEINEGKFRILGHLLAKRAKSLLVGIDYRKFNPPLLKSLAEGYGKPVDFVGVLPTPAVAMLSGDYGAMLTASHNPADYSGLKFFRGATYISKEEMGKIRGEFELLEEESKKSAGKLKGEEYGKSSSPEPHSTAIPKHNPIIIPRTEMVLEYLELIPDIENGIFDLAGGAVCALKELFPKRIFDVPDPEFKKHSPEPKDDTLVELKKETIQSRQIGFAFDGDGDRLQVCDGGKLIEGDITAAFIAENHLKGGDRAVLSIDCRQEVFEFLEDAGIHAITSKVGDAYVVGKALQTDAIFSAERSGHFTFYNHAEVSDGIYASAVLSKHKYGEFAEFAKRFKNVTLKEEVWFKADFGKLKELLEDAGAEKIETTDGVKAKFENYMLLIRASTTEPKIRINSEAQDSRNAKIGIGTAIKALKRAR
ncbi:MAG: hypothetical protein ABH863_03430 [Candidatus Micrarchaeota archaeon]